jgi:hypothetical protein
LGGGAVGERMPLCKSIGCLLLNALPKGGGNISAFPKTPMKKP